MPPVQWPEPEPEPAEPVQESGPDTVQGPEPDAPERQPVRESGPESESDESAQVQEEWPPESPTYFSQQKRAPDPAEPHTALATAGRARAMDQENATRVCGT